MSEHTIIELPNLILIDKKKKLKRVDGYKFDWCIIHRSSTPSHGIKIFRRRRGRIGRRWEAWLVDGRGQKRQVWGGGYGGQMRRVMSKWWLADQSIVKGGKSWYSFMTVGLPMNLQTSLTLMVPTCLRLTI